MRSWSPVVAMACSVVGFSDAFNLLPPMVVNKMRSHNQNHDKAQLQKSLGVPDGLLKTLWNHNDQFSKRIWIVDNSGSMKHHDGHAQLVHKTNNSSGNNDCTRWKELEETVLLHAQLSSALKAPTEFRLLNNNSHEQDRRPSTFRVGYGTMRNSLQQAQNVLQKTKPQGGTPLLESIAQVRNEIVQLLPQLKADGTKVSVVIVTDGTSDSCQTDQLGKPEAERHEELQQALGSLEGLPVSVVIRLCTDYGPLVDVYQTMDQAWDHVDVLDDYRAEAEDVYTRNPWLNYAMILHRMREMGQYSPLFDWLDERTLTRPELKEFCAMLFDRDQVQSLPDPEDDWKGFLEGLEQLQSKEKLHLNPRTQQMAPWIDIEGLSMLE